MCVLCVLCTFCVPFVYLLCTFCVSLVVVAEPSPEELLLGLEENEGGAVDKKRQKGQKGGLASDSMDNFGGTSDDDGDDPDRGEWEDENPILPSEGVICLNLYILVGSFYY
jgi:hypothetical protein